MVNRLQQSIQWHLFSVITYTGVKRAQMPSALLDIPLLKKNKKRVHTHKSPRLIDTKDQTQVAEETLVRRSINTHDLPANASQGMNPLHQSKY